MKVYVDKLPECCCECACCNHDVDYGACCNLGAFDYESDHQTLYKHPRCPLQSITDYTKQVGKEVCEEIRNKIEQAKMIYEWKGKEITIEEILDQIGETKC